MVVCQRHLKVQNGLPEDSGTGDLAFFGELQWLKAELSKNTVIQKRSGSLKFEVPMRCFYPSQQDFVRIVARLKDYERKWLVISGGVHRDPSFNYLPLPAICDFSDVSRLQ